MGLEAIGIALSVGTAAFGVLNSVAQMRNANANAAAATTAANQQLQAHYAEADRQQVEVLEVANEQKSDRMRQAAQELGTLRVASGELGMSGQSFTRAVTELAYAEGLDVSRIRTQAERNIESLQASKEAARQGHFSTLTQVENQRSIARQGATYQAIGTLLNVGADVTRSYVRRAERAEDREFYRNRQTS